MGVVSHIPGSVDFALDGPPSIYPADSVKLTQAQAELDRRWNRGTVLKSKSTRHKSETKSR